MTNHWPEYLLFLALVTALVKPLGVYMELVFTGSQTPFDRVLVPCERLFYKMVGIDPEQSHSWQRYSLLFVLVTALGVLFLFALMAAQALLPLYTLIDKSLLTTPITSDLALNTAVSFATTSTWQAYGGESTLSYLVQSFGLVSQNFLAGGLGLAVGIAFIRGLASHGEPGIGNFWRDLVRAILWILLPLGLLGSLFFVWQGVPMNFDAYTQVKTLQGARQVIAQGPVAALEFIKNLGTNGGGFFNVNGAHPYANPTPLTNFVGMLAIAALPAALTYTYGRMVKRRRDGWILYGIMAGFFAVGLGLCDSAEKTAPHAWQQLAPISESQNWEGKETRFGLGASVLATVTTSNGATGSYNSMLDSFTPLGGGIALLNLLFGEIFFGGLGTGLYSMIFVVLIAVFIGSLMAGRIPEYLGKRLGPAEIKLAAGFALVSPLTILPLASVAVSTAVGKAGLTTNQGARGFSEVLIAYASTFANNGLSFAGLSANTPFYNWTTAAAMLVGRVVPAVLALAFAGLMARQSPRPAAASGLATDSLDFAVLLIFTIIIIGGLSFLPVITLGPVAEYFQAQN